MTSRSKSRWRGAEGSRRTACGSVARDDREGVIVPRRKGVPGLAAERGLLNLAQAFDRLKRTNFRYRQESMDELLDKTSGEV